MIQERNQQIVALCLAGHEQLAIALRFGLSKQRIHQICPPEIRAAGRLARKLAGETKRAAARQAKQRPSNAASDH